MIELKDEPNCQVPPVPVKAPEPDQHAREHSWFVLGKEDNGEVLSRCTHCKTFRYEKDGMVRYEVPGE